MLTLLRKNYFLKLIFIVPAIALAFFVMTDMAWAGDTGIDKALKGLNQSAVQGYEGTNPGNEVRGPTGVIPDMPTAVGQIVGAGLAFIGVLFFGLMIYGGFIWMMARGNQQEITKAKELIVAAIIGVVIVVAAYAITRYVGEAIGLRTSTTQ